MINISKEDLILTFVHYAYMASLKDDDGSFFTKEQLDRCANTSSELNRITNTYFDLDDKIEQQKLNKEVEELLKDAVKGL